MAPALWSRGALAKVKLKCLAARSVPLVINDFESEASQRCECDNEGTWSAVESGVVTRQGSRFLPANGHSLNYPFFIIGMIALLAMLVLLGMMYLWYRFMKTEPELFLEEEKPAVDFAK